MLIREARPGDAAQLIELITCLSEETDVDVPLAPGEFLLTVEEEEKILADYAASDNSIFLVSEEAGQIVGSLTLRGGARKALHHAATLGMNVRRDRRNQGIGSQLLQAAMDWARHNTVLKRVELYVYARNQRAVHLYQKHGFEIEGRRRGAIFQNGEYLDDLIMAVLLDG